MAMAAAPDPEVEEITVGLHEATIDDVETQITVCTWNIMGKANAEPRKMVTTATFQYQYGDTNSLAQSDIICVQEMKAGPSGRQATSYLPFAGSKHYGVVDSKEPNANTYNAVYYNKEKFSEAAVEHLKQAYNLLDFKKACYDRIQQGGDIERRKAIKGDLSEWGDSDDEKRMCREVLRECKEARTLLGFHENRSKYMAPGEEITRASSDLLKRRLAICVLKIKSLPEQYIVAISLHNYSKGKSGLVKAPISFASLFFDFLSKLQYIRLNHIVIVAGDFNFDIRTYTEDPWPSLGRQYLASYHIPDYDLTILRSGLRKIDFIMVTKPRGDAKIEISMKEVQAHSLQVSREAEEKLKEKGHREVNVTNHSPVSAFIDLKLKK